MKAIHIAFLLLASTEATKLLGRQHSIDEFPSGHFPKNLDEETITALEISEQATDEARHEQI